MPVIRVCVSDDEGFGRGRVGIFMTNILCGCMIVCFICRGGGGGKEVNLFVKIFFWV